MQDAPAKSTPPATPPGIPDAAWTDADLAGDPHLNAEKAQKVRRMFGAIAHRYDLNNRLHSFGRDQAWRRVAVSEAALRPGDAVLDVACGTGDLASAFARAGAGSVTGLDFTPEMLAIARRRFSGKRATRDVQWIEGDAQALPMADGSFDVVSIAFGIRNVADPARAIREFRRVLRPGGRLVILEFSRPKSRLIAGLNDFYCGKIMPRTATLVSGDRSGAYRYLPTSVATFAGRAELAAMMRAAGFTGITQKPLTYGVCVCYRGIAAG